MAHRPWLRKACGLFALRTERSPISQTTLQPSLSPTSRVKATTIEFIYDSGCPICSLEAELLKKRDLYERIKFTDIAKPEQRGIIGYIDGMKRLRVILPSKKSVYGREVYRVAYEAIGLGWLYRLSRLPILNQLIDTAYDTWAEYELQQKGEQQLLTRFRSQVELLRNLETTTIDALTDYSSYSPVAEGQIDLLYDSECPICNMEVEFLKKRDIFQRIQFTDISSPLYNPKLHGNVNYVDGMKKLRAVLPDGRVITGVEVFRYTYDAIGLGWIFAATKLPVIGTIADSIYDVWAENRLRITGRTDLIEKLRQQAEALKAMEVEECEESCDLEEEPMEVEAEENELRSESS